MLAYKGSTLGLYPELSQALSPEGQLSRRPHGARRVGGASQLPHSGFPNPRIFHAALLLGLDRICLQATLVSVSQLELGRAPRQQSCRSARRCSELRFQKVRSLCPRGLCARNCVSCWGPGSVLWAPPPPAQEPASSLPKAPNHTASLVGSTCFSFQSLKKGSSYLWVTSL